MARCLLVLMLLFVRAAVSGDALETIALRHRTADEVIPILRPLLAEDDALTGQGFKLFVRARPDRIAALREAVAQLDVAARMLRISVARAGSVEEAESGQRARVRIGPDSAHANVRITQARRRDQTGDTQSVRVREGSRAFIATGSVEPAIQPLLTLDQGGYGIQHQLGERVFESGFVVQAHLRGDRVQVEINRQREAPNARMGGAIETESLVTTVTGRLGEWLELGGDGAFESRERTNGGYTYDTARRDRRIYMKVEYDL